VNEIRTWMGDFSLIRIPGKFAARMGQLFSSTVGTVTISDVQRITIEDVPDASHRYIFSDGCGLISSKAASRVANKLRLRRNAGLPSAFQVRFGGAKGMLTVWDEHVPRGTEVAVRQSMIKFMSDHGTLEIVGYAKRLPAFLNRQIIVILSGLGVQDEAFLRFQRKILAMLNEAMTESGAAAALDLLYTSGCGSGDVKLKTVSPMMDAAAMFRCGLTAVNCHHLFNLMTAYRRRALLDLSSRARISVEKGVCLIGVMDESGLLPADNIFVQYTDPATGSIRAVRGPVIVGRSPCLHPGDVQLAVAYYHPRLTHLVNVVVFSKHGERPLPSMLGGGDLDGDIFFVFWDNSLLPPKSSPAMDYTAVPPVPLDRDVTITDVIEHFIKYIRNDRLGQIASAHLAHADVQGIFSPECLRLATLHSTAVDFAKTGVPAEFPRDLRPLQFPDFMGKHRKLSYTSERVLGMLFRECHGSVSAHGRKEYTFEAFGNSQVLDNILVMDPRITAEFKEEAEQLCLEYNLNLMRVMQGLGVETEGEACSGQVYKFATSHAQVRGRREYFSLSQRLNRLMVDLRNRYRELFWSGLAEPSRSILEPRAIFKASAWYQACSAQVAKDLADGEVPMYSFPWVITDVLANIIRHELGQ
jgi:RNA-dependent RNA polymerase